MRSIYFAGLDLGQRQDPTALAVVEWAEYAGAWDAVAFEFRKETSLSLRYLERMPLGTPYPEVVYRVGGMMRSRQLAGGECAAPGGGRDGSGAGGGGSAAAGGSAIAAVAGDDHGRGYGEIMRTTITGYRSGT